MISLEQKVPDDIANAPEFSQALTDYKAGKWKGEVAYGQKEKGFIVLQDHKSEAWFKNIFIKEL